MWKQYFFTSEKINTPQNEGSYANGYHKEVGFEELTKCLCKETRTHASLPR